jgi:hypothetical protein
MDRRLYAGAIVIMLLTWVLLVATAPGIPIVWDEGEYMSRASLILGWLLLGPSALSSGAIQSHWQFVTYSEGHPAWFAIPIAFGQGLVLLAHKAGFAQNVDPLMAARLGPITVFSLACTAVAVRLKRDYGTVAAVAAPVALLTFPRIFSDAHFATQDGQLTAWWLMVWAADSLPARASAVGVLLGLTSATKFTGWFAWIPVVASRVLDNYVVALRRLVVMIPVALCVYYAVNPPLWFHPISGFARHLHQNLNRAGGQYDQPMLFFGQIYETRHPLPWYNTIVWLAIVTPVPTLALGLLGLFRCLVNRTKSSIMLILHWATMMVVRALPWAPPHDGIRLFLPAFGFWCIFAAIGAQFLWELSNAALPAPKALIRAGLAAAAIVCAVTVARYYPQTLSHYNLLAGGVRGAASQGMEPTYWWDALDPDVLNWLNEHTEPGAAIAVSHPANLSLLREWGQLRPKDVEAGTTRFKWYVLQNRPGMFSDIDRALVRGATPALVKYAGRRRAGSTVPSDLDVPLILVFSYEQYRRAAGIS